MDFSKLNPDTLRELIKLSELKSSLEKQLGSLNDRLSTLFTGKAPSKKTGKRRGRPPGKKKAVKAKAAKKAKAPKAAPKTPKIAKAPKAPKVPGRRGALKGKILELLAAAGPEGATVKDISTKLGVKNQNVHVWFATTGKKLSDISKVGEARYAYKVAGTTNIQPQA
jgi:hypothetical protein